MHVAVDDATRLAYAEELPDERGTTAAAFLERALAFYAAHGIEVRRLLTDNGSLLPRRRLPAELRRRRASSTGARGPTGRRRTARPRRS